MLLAACVLALAPTSLAAPPPAPSAVAQYVEMIPTGEGGKAVGVGKTASKPLAPPIARQVKAQAGSAGSLLTRVATSSAYGAPQSKLRRLPPTALDNRGQRSPKLSTTDYSALGATVDALEGARLRDLLILGLVVFAITGGFVWLGIRRSGRRASR